MRVVSGEDHAGGAFKQKLGDDLQERSHEVIDAGIMHADLGEDPDYAEAVGPLLLGGGVDQSGLICGSGVGTFGAANTLPGMRAAVHHDTYAAR